MNDLPQLQAINIHWSYLLLIAIFYLLAYVNHRLSGRVARRLVSITPQQRQLRPERLLTLRGVAADLISVAGYLLATIFSLSLFVDTSTLIWIIGLFSAAFGFGARPLVSDFLAGLNFLFENSFTVGEKVEIEGLPGGSVQGTVEQVNLRTTLLRATTGELFWVPNGEIRVVRNFSRGRFSPANIHIKVAGHDLNRTLVVLEELAVDAPELLPNLLEPWQVISETGSMGEATELTLVARARFGQAAEMRPRLLSLIQERLAAEGIELVG